eukprot:gene10064-7034_t
MLLRLFIVPVLVQQCAAQSAFRCYAHHRQGASAPGSPRHPSGNRAAVTVEHQLRESHKELRRTQQELLQVRLQLMEEQRHTTPAVRQLLERLTTQDVAAHRAATEIRYTAMALDASADRLEVELRALLSIGLTPGEVDAAAVEAGARQYIRSNIGFRAESVSREPPVAIPLGNSEMSSQAANLPIHVPTAGPTSLSCTGDE